MTQILKKQLSSLKKSGLLAFLILATFNLALFAILFKKFALSLFLSYLISLVVINRAYQRYKKNVDLLEIKKQDLLEQGNLLNKDISKEQVLSQALIKKNLRYSSLKIVLDKFNQTLILDEVVKVIARGTFNLFDSCCEVLLYLINSEDNSLELAATEKTAAATIIKEKHGDLFDKWVLRRAQPLLVEDINNDFRFDTNSVKVQIKREITSLMSVPLIAGEKFIGILRIESSFVERFSPEDLRLFSIVGTLASISLENSLLYEKTEELAIRDGLTGLYLRRFLDERGKEEFKYAMLQKSDLSLLMIDIDFFKKYNDQFGHRSGDIVLMHLADLLRGVFNDPSYIVSRFGGEEFAVLLPKTKKARALKLAKDLSKIIRDGVIFLRRTPIKLTVSIGVATYSGDADNWLDLIKQSDTAMYKAKQEGRDRVCTV